MSNITQNKQQTTVTSKGDKALDKGRTVNLRNTGLLSQQGVGLIEILITLVILAVGLLGVASLQFVGSFSNKEALARTNAVLVAQQMSERLRASSVVSNVTDGFVVNNTYFDSNAYNFASLSCTSGKPPYECFCLALPAGLADCESNQCTPAEIAAFDAHQMSCATVKENPNASISVTCDDLDNTDADACTAGSLHRIMITWPMKSWREQVKIANPKCNASNTANNDCVVVEVTL